MELLLIRHALPERIERAAGPADPPLAPLGRDQAAALASALEDETVDALYASPLRRAVQTAEPTAAALGLDVVIDDELAEYDRASSEYVPLEELRAMGDPRWRQMVEVGFVAVADVDAEAWMSQAVAAVERLIGAHPGQKVALVCHGGVINAYASWVVGTSRRMFFEPAYCSINRVVASRSGAREIRSLNETAHIRALLPR